MRIELPRGKLPVESLHALDWLNFFLAALPTTFGPIRCALLGKSRMGVYRYWSRADCRRTDRLVNSGPRRRTHRYDPIQALVGAGNCRSRFGAVDLRAAAGSALNLRRSRSPGGGQQYSRPGIIAISLGLVGPDGLAERLRVFWRCRSHRDPKQRSGNDLQQRNS
jgi:hypothetical protein